MEFSGVPVGPFVGKQAIAAAYREQPPDDELRVLEEREARAGSRRGMRGSRNRTSRRASSC
jgi:hypothetical protein